MSAVHAADKLVVRGRLVHKALCSAVDRHQTGFGAVPYQVRVAQLTAIRSRENGYGSPERSTGVPGAKGGPGLAGEFNTIAAVALGRHGPGACGTGVKFFAQCLAPGKAPRRQHHTAPAAHIDRLAVAQHGDTNDACAIDVQGLQWRVEPVGHAAIQHTLEQARRQGIAKDQACAAMVAAKTVREKTQHQFHTLAPRCKRPSDGKQMLGIAQCDHHAAEHHESGKGIPQVAKVGPEQAAVEHLRVESPPPQGRTLTVGVVVG